MRRPDLSYGGEVSRFSLSPWNQHLRGEFSSSLIKVGEKPSPAHRAVPAYDRRQGQCSPPRGMKELHPTIHKAIHSHSCHSKLYQTHIHPTLAHGGLQLCTLLLHAVKIPPLFWQQAMFMLRIWSKMREKRLCCFSTQNSHIFKSSSWASSSTYR